MIKKRQDTRQDFHKALFAYRSYPLQNGLFPSQMLMDWRIKITLPIHPERLQAEVQHNVVSEKIQTRQQQKDLLGKHSRPLKSLNPQQKVRAQDYRTGLLTVIAAVLCKVAPRSYEVNL